MFTLIFLISIAYIYALTYQKQQNYFLKEKTICLKALLAIGIVLHHLSFSVINPLLGQFHGWGKIIVSLFFFMSGYGLIKSWILKGRFYIQNFIGHRILKSLMLPLIVCSVFYGFLNGSKIPMVQELIYNLLILGSPYLPNAWFVYVLLMMYFSFYLGCKIVSGKHVIKFVSTMCILFISYSIVVEMGDWVYVSVLCFPLGMYYSAHENILISLLKKKFFRFSILYIFLPIILVVVASLYYIDISIVNVLVYPLFSLIVVLLLSVLDIERLSKYKVVVWLSGLSYEIYLCHGVVMNFLRGSNHYVISNFLFIFFTFLLTLIMSFFVHKLISFIK